MTGGGSSLQGGVDDNTTRTNVTRNGGSVEAVFMQGSTSGNEESTRHASPYLSPALRSSLLAASPNSRETTPNRHRVTVESLLRRPRSNQRNRTPSRYESPLDPAAFRRDEPSPERVEGQRITVRPLAGAPVGTTLGARRIRELRTGRPMTPQSSKQGPSRRKVRRWNNDNFSGIASEIAKSSSRGAITAELLLQAQVDAPLYVSVYPEERESTVSKFMVTDDPKMKCVRNEFFEGEIGYPSQSLRSQAMTTVRNVDLSPKQMLKLIPERLRNVLIRACSSSQTTIKIVTAFEEYLVQSFAEIKATPTLSEVAASSLLEHPAVIRTESGGTVARFYFDSESSTGGFHRLLLHAVCQFHSLQAVSKTVELETQSSRLLTVTGSMLGSNVKLCQLLQDLNMLEVSESLSSLCL